MPFQGPPITVPNMVSGLGTPRGADHSPHPLPGCRLNSYLQKVLLEAILTLKYTQIASASRLREARGQPLKNPKEPLRSGRKLKKNYVLFITTHVSYIYNQRLSATSEPGAIYYRPEGIGLQFTLYAWSNSGPWLEKDAQRHDATWIRLPYEQAPHNSSSFVMGRGFILSRTVVSVFHNTSTLPRGPVTLDLWGELLVNHKTLCHMRKEPDAPQCLTRKSEVQE